MKTPALTVLAMLLAFAALGCARGGSSGDAPSDAAGGADLMLLSGSENKSLEPLFQRFAEQNHIGLHVDYLGSVDVMLQLENGAPNYDAIWPANSLWVDLGDRQKRVRHLTSMRSPSYRHEAVRSAGELRLDQQERHRRPDPPRRRGEPAQVVTPRPRSPTPVPLPTYQAVCTPSGSQEILTHAHLQDPKLRATIKRLPGHSRPLVRQVPELAERPVPAAV